ncbi:unnamed protein product [Mytilus coruscus]|uniref:Retrotransposon gag domain-containing protein n=1 Tax=Mytilus coruscus TaxID=42192 RepID=A0A6J8B9H3_MYTCO|nr:unnamed protein product [Mytilus coruscus]
MASSIQVPKFCDESSHVPSQWWKLLESYQICSKMSDEQTIASLQFHFNDQAQLWFNSLEGATRNNIQNLKTAFLNRFSNRKTSSKLFKIQQLDQESGHQYLTRIQQLSAGAAELSESAIIELAINGMTQNLKPHVVSHDPKTFDELRRSVEIANNVINCKPHQTQNNYCSHNFNNSCNDNHSHNNSSNISANDITQLCSSLAESFKSVKTGSYVHAKNTVSGRQQYERERTDKVTDVGVVSSVKLEDNVQLLKLSVFIVTE